MFGAKADEVGRLRAERRGFNPPRDFHRVIGYDLMFDDLLPLSKYSNMQIISLQNGNMQ